MHTCIKPELFSFESRQCPVVFQLIQASHDLEPLQDRESLIDLVIWFSAHVLIHHQRNSLI